MYKKILILLIIILAIYVLSRLFTRRRILLEKQKNSQLYSVETVENFTDANTIDAIPQNLTLTNYFVKSSYNSCFDSNAIINPFSSYVLRGVLQKGYRFIDMELCNMMSDSDNPIHVCINKYYNDDSNQDSSNTFPLKDAISQIINIGLTMTDIGAKNYYEPLFIHIRIKHGNLSDDAVKSFYGKINEILFSTTGVGTDLGNFVYPLNAMQSVGNSNSQKLASLTLSQIINSNKKCFIIIDKTNLKEDSLYDSNGNSVFNSNVIMSGFNTGEIPLYKYDDVRVKDGVYVLDNKDGNYESEKNIIVSGDKINKTTFSIAISGNKYESINFYPYDIAKKYGVQFATMNFTVNDEGMKKYEKIFKSSKLTGFVPISQVIKQAATDVRSDVKNDIRRGIYIGFGIISAVGLIYGIYKYGGLANFLRGRSQTGGGANDSRRSKR